MGKPSRLRKRELRELSRMNRSRESLSVFLGQSSEEAAESICHELRQAGLIENFWPIPKYSILDRRGVDIVCETPRGYFLFNVKKSFSGVSSFERKKDRFQRSNIQTPPIFPWRVTLEVSKKQEAKTELERILSGDPSFDSNSLPEDIRQELKNPTYPPQKPVKNRARREQLLTPEDRLNQLRKDGLVKNLRLERRKVWQIRLTAIVGNSPVEVIKYGKHEEAKQEAYEQLLNKIK